MKLAPFRNKLRDYLHIAGVHFNSNNMARCPLAVHPNGGDKHPSFHLGGPDAENAWYCFGCSEGGTIFDFAHLYYGLPAKGEPGFEEITLKQLAYELGLDYSPPKKIRSPKQKKYLTYFDVLRFIVGQLTLRPAAQFLQQRKISVGTAKRSHIGVLANPRSTMNALLSKYDAGLLQEFGILNGNQQMSEVLSGDRIIFPIYNKVGAPVALNARVLDDNSQRNTYMVTPNNEYYRKHRVLYNLNRLRSKDTVIVVEGVMDALSLMNVGVQDVVALLGKEISEYHQQVLSGFRKVVMFLDSDPAGIAATKKAITALPNVYVKMVPEEYGDPDEFIRATGVDGFAALEYMSPLEFSILTDEGDHREDVAKRYLDAIAVAEPIKHARCLAALVNRTGYPLSALQEGLDRRLSARARRTLQAVLDKGQNARLTVKVQINSNR